MSYKSYLVKKVVKESLTSVLQFSFTVVAIVPYKICVALGKKSKAKRDKRKQINKELKSIYHSLRYSFRRGGSEGISNFSISNMAESEMRRSFTQINRNFDEVVEILRKDKSLKLELADFSKCKYAITYDSNKNVKTAYIISLNK